MNNEIYAPMVYEKTDDELFIESFRLQSFEQAFNDGWNFLQRTYEGYETPWSNINKDFKFIKGELNLFSGYTGQGKSEVVSHIGLHSFSQGAKVFMASLEMSTGQLHSRMVSQITGTLNPTKEIYQAATAYVGDNVKFYSMVGHVPVESVLESAKLLLNIGYDFFIFDNLMMLDKKSDDYNRQLEIIQKLSEFTKKNNVCSVLVAHSKKPQNRMSNTDQNKYFYLPTIYDVMGASAIANIVDNHISITINQQRLRALQKMKEGIPHEKLFQYEQEALQLGDTIFKRDKKREWGEFFIKSLYYDKNFRCLKDFESKVLKPYIHYTKIEEEKEILV